MKYFNYENYLAIVEATKNDEDIPGMIYMMAENCRQYVDHVVKMENALQVASFHLSTEEFQTRAMELDTRRRYFHDGVIAALGPINRICTMFDVGPVFNGNIEDRYEVADFAIEFVDKVFENRTDNAPTTCA